MDPSRRAAVSRPAALLTAAAIAAGTLAGCGGASHASGRPATVAGAGPNLAGRAQPVAFSTSSVRDLARSQTAFGVSLLARRCLANPQGNQVLSPASAALALTMLDAGARGGTRDAVNRLLHLPRRD